jgi:hypothetical protein
MSEKWANYLDTYADNKTVLSKRYKLTPSYEGHDVVIICAPKPEFRHVPMLGGGVSIHADDEQKTCIGGSFAEVEIEGVLREMGYKIKTPRPNKSRGKA